MPNTALPGRQQRNAAVTDPSMLALTTALQHPALSTDPSILCAAARACKAWREAVQQCSACNTVVTIKPDAPLRQLCSFTQWLARHAPLVKSISAMCGYLEPGSTAHGLQWQQHAAVSQQLLQQALQVAALQATVSPAAAAAALTPAATASQQQQANWRLSSFSSNCLVTTGTLAALPGHSLTCLQVDFMHSSALDGALLSAALAQLSNLQQLSLFNNTGNYAVAGSCLLGLAQLKQLTSLKLHGTWSNSGQPLQQLLAQPLPLRQLVMNLDAGRQQLPALDMSALSRLQGLTAIMRLPEGSVLPPQLQQLQLGHRLHNVKSLSAVLPLQQLQRLSLLVGVQEQQQLLQLAQLPALQHLVLEYNSTAAAAGTAAAWPQLPQLRELSVGVPPLSFSPSRLQMEAMLAGIAGSTGLTQLSLTVQEVTGEPWIGAEEPEPIAACARLTGLLHLTELHIVCGNEGDPWLEAGDALALTALTGLTSLILDGLHSAVGELEATALACNLTQLRHLDLTDNQLGSIGCLAAIAKLTQLTELVLVGNNGLDNRLTQRSLMVLTALSRLQKLTVPEIYDVSLDQFWAALRGQQRQQP